MTTDDTPTGGELRIGDAERVDAVQDLSRHFAEGRLDQTEFDERSSAVYAARTRSDLAPLFFDLPGSRFADPAAKAATEGAERSGRTPVHVTGSEAVADPDRDAERSRRRRNIVLTVIPTIALILFLVLGYLLGFQYSWVVWLAVPVARAIVGGPDDDGRGDGPDGGDDRRRDRRDRRRRGELG